MANAYGWAKDSILESMYFDEAWEYFKRINKRKIVEYKTLVNIQHGDPKETMQGLDEVGKKSIDSEIPSNELDKSGFAALKNAMRGNPRIVIKD